MAAMDLINTALSVGSGGVFGLIGAIAGKVTNYFQEKQRQAFEEKKWKYETDLLKLNMQADSQKAEHELAVTNQKGSWDGLKASYDFAKTSDTHKVVTDIKALFRPFLTTLLWIISAWMFFQIKGGAADQWFTGNPEAVAITRYMVYTVFFSASTSTAWWFGDRALSPPQLKHK